MDSKVYYEAFDWSQLKAENLEKKTETILKMIPDDVHKIIDIGCGNGLITNVLSKKYEVVGADRSAKALESVTCSKINCSCDQIPSENQSFDLVFSSELLEHLETPVLEKTVKEFVRLSKKYLLISTPFAENLEKSFIQCPHCRYIFNRASHLQKFDLDKISELFPDFSVIDWKTEGALMRQYKGWLLKLKHRFSPAASWIPAYWTKGFIRETICPKCEKHFAYPYKFHLVSFICDSINTVLSQKKPFWIIVLLEKKSYPKGK